MGKRKTKKFLKFVVAIILIVAILSAVYISIYGFDSFKSLFDKGQTNQQQTIVVEGELSIHMFMLGNDKAGDCIYIKAGENDILIDGGSDFDSLDDITSYVDTYCTDNTLEYVIVTHADADHIACFGGKNATAENLFTYYECKTIIDFAKSNKTTKVYERYLNNREKEVLNGAVHYTALDCINGTNGAKREYELGESLSFKVLDNYFYRNNSSDENNYSVCIEITHGERNFLFTGDLEKEGEKKLIELNSDLGKVDLYKANHHGSNTSSTAELLSVIKPDIVIIDCCAGSVEYTQNLDNTFPTKDFLARIKNYTERVYCPVYTNVHIEKVINKKGVEEEKYVNDDNYGMLNGNIVVVSDKDGIKMNFSNNDTSIYNTEWYQQNRAA